MVTIAGQCYGEPNGVKRGQVLDLPDHEAMRVINCGHAQANWRDPAGIPYQTGEQQSMVTKGTRRVWEGWKA